MEYLKGSQHEVITLASAVDLILNKERLEKDYVVLTFDDGCERFYDITFPILSEFGFASTVYPVANHLGSHAVWGKVRNPGLKIMTQNMVTELARFGVEIGAHTMDHYKLTHLSKQEARYQVQASKERLEQLVSKEIDSFAYPHGDYNAGIVGIVKEAGFRNALTCVSAVANASASVYEIPRKYVTYYDDMTAFEKKTSRHA